MNIILPCIFHINAGLTVNSSWVAFKHSWPWPWPWIGSYGILSCISYRALSTHQISLKLEKLCREQTNRRHPSKIKELQKPVTLTLTLDRVIRHTVMHHSSTSIYTPNFIEIGKTFCGWTDRVTDGQTDVQTYLLDGRTFPPLYFRQQSPSRGPTYMQRF